MTIAITGATGQLGRLVIDTLKTKRAADGIIALARNAEKAAGLGVPDRSFDYDAPETLASALDGVDTLLLISGSDIGRRVPQHAAVIEAAKAAGVQHIVYTSLLNAPNSTLGLAPEHVETEKLLAASGIGHTVLRNNWAGFRRPRGRIMPKPLPPCCWTLRCRGRPMNSLAMTATL